MPDLFDSISLRGVVLRNRIGIAPMQQYCAGPDGRPTAWHLGNLLPRALGGAGLVFTESTAVNREGRVGNGDLGLWDDAQIAGHAVLAGAIAAAGAVPAVQLGHCGRKASRNPPWQSGELPGAWTPIGPSAIAFGNFVTPRAMTEGEITSVIADYGLAARRAVAAGYRVVELHAAHGYLLHQFLSPLANARTDDWGGSFENRCRLTQEVVKEMRSALPDDVALAVRVSHTDWVEGGWTTAETARLAHSLKALGVDLLDVSSGGMSPAQDIPLGPGYQVPAAATVRAASGIAVAAVGLITDAAQAQAIVAEEKADMVLIARASMRDPYWPLHAAAVLGVAERLRIPPQYERGWTGFGTLELDRSIAAPLPALA